ncbi:MarR family transcriptional regulator [Pseudonocardia sp. GCM10023141]|uniref:MarR family transcriptional regulator n=1 Tax=Pseudonocardia sp. GCM10023141 TaxID=3252653 RepID=UPI00360CDD66
MIDTATATRFQVLHALKVKGVASEAALSEVTGLSQDAVLAEVEHLLEAELVRRRKGRLGGLALVDAGRAVHAELLSADVDAAAVGALEDVYQAFLPLNGRFKDLCTRWQLRGSELNDHTDAAYDAGVVSELAELHGAAAAFLGPAGAALARFARYPLRLGAALERVQGGEVSAFTKPLTESYHDVWMELHQDLITSLGRTRDAADEG